MIIIKPFRVIVVHFYDKNRCFGGILIP